MDSHRIRCLAIAIATIGSMTLIVALALPAGESACEVLTRTWPVLNWLSSAVPLQPVALFAHGC